MNIVLFLSLSSICQGTTDQERRDRRDTSNQFLVNLFPTISAEPERPGIDFLRQHG